MSEAATGADPRDRGRESFDRQDWSEAFSSLSTADREQPLAADNLERLAIAAHLLGRDTESAEIMVRAHQEFLATGNASRAARCAFWVALPLMFKGETAQAGGWLSRGRRLLDDAQLDCVERGYLHFPLAFRAIHDGDIATAHATFKECAEIGKRFGDRDLVVLARQGEGRVLIRQGKTAEGVALLDEVMVAVTAGEVSPMMVGDIYCSVIEACHEIFDLGRAREWTAAMTRWCEDQGDRIAFRGHCLIRRAEILQLHGAWPDAIREAERACECLSQPPPHRAVGSAFYQVAELHRLRGDFTKAEEAYREAGKWSRRPNPGLAQLRLAQKQIGAASAAIRSLLDEAQDLRTRSAVLGASVEIALAAGDISGARGGASELAELTARLGAPFLEALSARATGAVLLHEGQARAALPVLRRAWTLWCHIEAPYEAARTQVLIGLACRSLGDEEAAEMELDAARQVFLGLGAEPDLLQLEELSRPGTPAPTGGLTAREIQVLSLVATGKTNRGIADELRISEKTVARHVSNIFTKLNLSSRAAATAYAYQHALV
jgi:DNA-binding CsgD family transcriptional regulator/tetratricopeptide (TPR) repeat protein